MVPMNLFTGWEQRHPDIENGPVGTAGGGAGWGKERAALKYMRCAVLHSVTSVLSDSLQLPWTITHQAPLSMGFSRQEYWSTLPCPSPGDLPDPGIELTSFTSPALTGGFFTASTTWEAHMCTLSSLFIPLPMAIYVASISWLL